MFYLGIDVAKNKHDACIIENDGTIILDNFCFDNSREGFNNLLQQIDLLRNNYDDFQLKVALEPTGHYGNNLLFFLKSHEFEVTLFNPLSTNLFRKAMSIRKTKTDRIDAKVIATMLLSNQSGNRSITNEQADELKLYTRHRQRLTQKLTSEKVQLTRLLDIAFPELSTSIWSVHQKSCHELLKIYPTVFSISTAHLTSLTSLLSKYSKGRYGRDKAFEIRELARNSIGTSNQGLAFEVISTIKTIEHFQHEIETIDKEIKNLMIQIASPILSIPGISFRLGSVILAEVGDIHRFQNHSKLLAFSGLDPSIYQSGNFQGDGHMVKRGSKYLRGALMQAARLVSMRCPTFQKYLRKKLDEGKHYFVALSHVAKKLVRLIYFLLKNQQDFDPLKSY